MLWNHLNFSYFFNTNYLKRDMKCEIMNWVVGIAHKDMDDLIIKIEEVDNGKSVCLCM